MYCPTLHTCRIERSVEKTMDRLDEKLMAGVLSQRKYDAKVKALDKWAERAAAESCIFKNMPVGHVALCACQKIECSHNVAIALGIGHETNPASAGRMAAAIDDGELVGGTPADQGVAAAMIDDHARKAGDAPRIRAETKPPVAA